MVDPSLFLTAAGFGVAVAAPVGPMSLLCMRRTVALGWRTGLATGAGIATGDACYALVAGLGLAGLSAFMLAHERPLHLAAGLFLMYLGLRTLLARAPDESTSPPAAKSAAAAFASSVLLTLTNPPTIIMFAAIFASLAPRGGFSASAALLTVAGVFAGSLAWWIGLVAVISALRHAMGSRVRQWIDRIAGAVLAFVGAVEIRRAL